MLKATFVALLTYPIWAIPSAALIGVLAEALGILTSNGNRVGPDTMLKLISVPIPGGEVAWVVLCLWAIVGLGTIIAIIPRRN